MAHTPRRHRQGNRQVSRTRPDFMLIANAKLTMREAADYYVAHFFGHRKVGEWRGDCFQLADGVKWYRVHSNKCGWEVAEVDYTPSPIAKATGKE